MAAPPLEYLAADEYARGVVLPPRIESQIANEQLLDRLLAAQRQEMDRHLMDVKQALRGLLKEAKEDIAILEREGMRLVAEKDFMTGSLMLRIEVSQHKLASMKREDLYGVVEELVTYLDWMLTPEDK
jgi:hypothetical protein